MSMEDALLAAKALDESRQAAGFDQTALDQAALQGLSKGAFEDSEEDSSAIAEEFYPSDEGATPAINASPSKSSARPSLTEQLDAQITRQSNPSPQPTTD